MVRIPPGNWFEHELGTLRVEEQLRELGCRVIEEKWGCRLVEIDEDESKKKQVTIVGKETTISIFMVKSRIAHRRNVARRNKRAGSLPNETQPAHVAQGSGQGGPLRATRGAGRGDPRGEAPPP